jgi:(1->4)-alpha-D-glucan 1-alpha-D-glucosylmutase
LVASSDRRHLLERVQDYMTKAVHEAKVNLSWVNPNQEYVDALCSFIDRALTASVRRRPNTFLELLERFLPPVQFFGAINSLAQLLLKLTAPGIPDVYQGNELWDFSLVDPDNRRPVDFDLRQRMLRDIEQKASAGDHATLCRELLAEYQTGAVKLLTTSRALCFRRDHGGLFQFGSYVPMYGAVEKQEHLCAFARIHEREIAITAVPRLSYTLMGGEMRPPIGDAWGNAELALPSNSAAEFLNVLTGETVKATPTRSLLCRELFASFPVALLIGR